MVTWVGPGFASVPEVRNTIPGDYDNEVDDIDCRLAVLLRQRNGRECVQLWSLRKLLPHQELLQFRAELLCSRPHLLRSRAGLRSDVRRSRCFLLWQQRLQQRLPESLLENAQAELLPPFLVLQAEVLQAAVLQIPLQQAQLLRSRADLLRSRRSDVLRSRTGRSDLRRSRRCVLQLVVDFV
jgi:hypothetical protein